MENRAKQKKENIKRFKKKLNLTIKPENYEHIKNNGLNVSRFVDNAINELRTKTNNELVFILEKEPVKWTRRDLNARPPPCEGDVITD